MLYDFPIDPKKIMSTRDEIGKELTDNGFDNKTVNCVMLLFEEIYMMIYEHNEKKDRLEGECAILIKDKKIRIITRDSGVSYDLTDPDLKISSLRSYIMTNIAEHVSLNKQHLVTMSFNRNVFEVDGNPSATA